MINPFNQHHGIIMYNSINRSKCCICIPTRIGVPLILTAWIVGKKAHSAWFKDWLKLTQLQAVSLFFASFSFMNKSGKWARGPKEQTAHSKTAFFSYFSAPATIVFGVINVLFVLVLLYGYTLHVIYRSVNRYRQYAKLFACFVSAILIDMFVNCILFAVKRDEFIHWCSSRSTDAFQRGTAIAFDTQTVDTLEFNCYKLHDTEAKLSFMFLVFFVFVFVSHLRIWLSFDSGTDIQT